MEIEKLIKLKNSKYKIKFTNDEHITTYDQVILNNDLLLNKTITIDQLEKINVETHYYDEYYKALNYIKRKLRSESEIRKYLKESVSLEMIIEQLKINNLINDDKFSIAFVRDKFNLNNMGPNKIKKELLKHDIKLETVNKHLETIPIDEIYEKLKFLIIKKIKSNTKDSKFKLKQKILYDMISKGYDKDMIDEIFENNYILDNNIIIKEYNKVYNKLKTKYNDHQLVYNIRKKLYQSGFSIDEINNVIEQFQK